ARIRLELERGDDRTGVDLCDRPFDRELAALLAEQLGAVEEVALVDLALDFWRIEQSERWQGVVALARCGWRCDRLRIREWERWHRDFWWFRRRSRYGFRRSEDRPLGFWLRLALLHRRRYRCGRGYWGS